MTVTFKLRRGPASEWATDNPILRAGEPGLEIDTGKFKIGNGYTVWSSLPYFLHEGATAVLIQAAIEDAVLEGVPGPEGPQGIQGIQGIQGVPGTAGTNGTNGAQGIQGVPGADGEDGAQGIQGVPGADGESVTVTLVDAEDWPPASDSNPLHLYFRVA
jgi:hypothetical protein